MKELTVGELIEMLAKYDFNTEVRVAGKIPAFLRKESDKEYVDINFYD